LEHIGEWIQIKNRFADLCLEYTYDGEVIVNRCDYGLTSQTFLVKANYIQTTDGRCLDLEGGIHGTNVNIYDCHYQPNQYWIIQEPAIKTFSGAQCLDIEGGIYEGRNVIAWECHADENQAWQINPVPSPRSGPCPQYLCEIEPCEVEQCQLFPYALGEGDYCECRCRFTVNGNEVRCDPQAYPTVNQYFLP
jgi:hypothetical protein